LSSKEKKAADSQDLPEKSDKSTVREYFESICVAVILALFVRTFVFQAFKIPTGSMEENLLVGDHLIVNKMLYAPTANPMERNLAPVREVERQDVVVFKFPDDPERDFIKRVVALPGERIRIENKKVYINGEPLDEPYAHFLEVPGTDENVYSDPRGDDMHEIVVPEGHYFVMGDNRDNSHDSRFWGTLPRDLLKGRALMIYWSYESGRDAYLKEGWEWFKEFLSIIPNFGSKTRWDRFFHLVR